jgi:hypothetical protein
MSWSRPDTACSIYYTLSADAADKFHEIAGAPEKAASRHDGHAEAAFPLTKIGITGTVPNERLGPPIGIATFRPTTAAPLN